MRLLGLTLQRTAEGLEIRCRYAYNPHKPPRQDEVKKEVSMFLQNALAILSADEIEKSGLQREDFSEERATMSFTQAKPRAPKPHTKTKTP